MLFYLKKLLSVISLFFCKGVFSGNDIKKLLGKQIFIYPFYDKNLKGASYNLTASKLAFIIDNDDECKNEELIVNNEDDIIIPEHETAIIETDESIYVSNRVCGSYHSRVKLVNKGLAHIGTTLDPCYFGTSAIALQNTTDHKITIKVGDPIVSIMFYNLRTRSDGSHDNLPGRQDIINLNVDKFYHSRMGSDQEKEIINSINEWKEIPWRNDKSKLVKKVQNYVIVRDFNKDITIESFLIITIGIIAMAYSFTKINKDPSLYKDIYGPLIGVIIPSTVLIIGVIIKYKEIWLKNNKG